MKKKIAVFALLALPMLANAAGPDFTSLTDSIDLSTAITAVLAAFGAVIVVLVALLGGRQVLKALKAV